MSANWISGGTAWGAEVATLSSLFEMTATTISAACGSVSAALLSLLTALPDPALFFQREASTYIRYVLRVWTPRGDLRRATISSPPIRREARDGGISIQ